MVCRFSAQGVAGQTWMGSPVVKDAALRLPPLRRIITLGLQRRLDISINNSKRHLPPCLHLSSNKSLRIRSPRRSPFQIKSSRNPSLSHSHNPLPSNTPRINPLTSQCRSSKRLSKSIRRRLLGCRQIGVFPRQKPEVEIRKWRQSL